MICENLSECCENEKYICSNKDKCIVYRDSRAQAVCEEKKKRYNLINDKKYKVALFHMDGGIIFGEKNIQKCDFMYIIYDPGCPTAIFVELKGNDIYHAVRQLKASIDQYGKILKRRISARIICNAVPRLYNDPLFKNLKKELMKQYQGGTFVISEKNMNEKYSDI